ncbi:MAG: hypothetical protein E6H88_10565 [Chloroflexi bacterium]|nr:MAG: hypothetical protein E6H88_10565 [Chloroflexota bacterium]
MRRGGLATALSIALGVLIGIGAAVGLSRATPPAALVTPEPSIIPATIPPPGASAAATTASPTRTPLPIIVSAYSYGGRRYAAVTTPVGFMYAAPFAGTVQVRTYQLIGGEIRLGSNVPSQPFFPYITLTSAERRIVYRPGALDSDTQIVAPDGAKLDAGAPLYKVIGAGASSWRTFYDPSVTAQLIVSLAALPGDAELDPVPLFAGP